MATHSSVLAWRIPGTGEPDGLPSLGSHRVGHDWSDLAAAAAAPSPSHTQTHRYTHTLMDKINPSYWCPGNVNPPQYSCLENPMARGAWHIMAHGITKSWTWLSDQASMHWYPGQAMVAPCPVCFRELPWRISFLSGINTAYNKVLVDQSLSHVWLFAAPWTAAH